MHMIIQTIKEINGVVYDYTYSDSGYMIERDGVRYSEAVDPINSCRLYTETDEPINVGTKYVSSSGSDNNVGIQDAPFKTVNPPST